MTEDERQVMIQSMLDPGIEDIEAAILELLRDIPALEWVDLGESVQPQAYPAASVALSAPARGEEQTGGVVEYAWSWVVRLYVDYTDPDYYTLYKAILITVMRKFLSNPSLLETCYRHELNDSGPAVPIPEAGLLIKTFQVVAEMEEVEL